jgi:hypothetical protein
VPDPVRQIAHLSALALIVSLLLLPTFSAATTPSFGITAPFSHARVSSALVQHQRVAAGGTANLSRVTLPFFNASTGRGGFGAKIVTSGPCNSPCWKRYQFESIRANLSVRVPIPTVANATAIVANWTAGLKWSWQLNSGGCQTKGSNSPGCLIRSNESFVVTSASLVDLTIHSSVCAGNCTATAYSNDSYVIMGCNAGWCNGGRHSNGTFAAQVSWSDIFHVAGLTSGHRYCLQFGFAWRAIVLEAILGVGYLPSTAVQSEIAMASLGNGIRLVSVSIT